MDKAYLEITNMCNRSCSFCHGTKRPFRLMKEEEFEVLTDRLVGEVKYLYFHLMGEPLMHPLLPKFIKRAKEKGFAPIITTNGTLLPGRGQGLIEAGPFKVSISLHSPEANGAFATPQYLSGCIAFAKAAAVAGVIVVFRLWNKGGKEAGNGAVMDALKQAFPAEWGEIRSGFCLEKHVFLEMGRLFEWPDIEADPVPPETPLFCRGLRDQIGILVDGTVVPCCLDAEGYIALGNLHETPLADILHSPRAKAMYDAFSGHRAIEPLCLRCGFVRIGGALKNS